MNLPTLIAIVLLLQTSNIFSEPFLQVPIEGEQGKDWRIVNYVDWDTIAYKDYNCGTKSYDGHQGTDFTLPSFPAMDKNVAVLAAASGRVTYVIDTLFDRETEGDVSKMLGNFVAVSHPNNYYTYYAHLMTGSAKVKAGDSVTAGDVLGYVGSSGNSTDPHLHFELWYDSLYPVDPLGGECGNESSLFFDPPAYDTSAGLYESGMHLAEQIGINDLRERAVTLERPYKVSTGSDSLLYFWSHMYGMRAGETLDLVWTSPDGNEWFSFDIVIDRDYWYYFYWSYINHTDLPQGDWTATLYYKGEAIAQENFIVGSSISVENDNLENSIELLTLEELMANKHYDYSLYNVSGNTIINKEYDQLPSGIYFIYLEGYKGNRKVLKKYKY
ncbi:MAG: hypothetical protein Kapaf2KO_06770 [Candidatus Kapaibacteriales bacterium]